MSNERIITSNYTMYDCGCSGGGLVPHRMDIIEDFETKKPLLFLLHCSNCEKETRMEFNNEKK